MGVLMPIIPIDQLPENVKSKGIIPIDQLPEEGTNNSFASELLSETDSILNKNKSFDLGAVDDLMIGLAPNDSSRMRYLAERYQGSNVSQDQEGNILVDGNRINPKGFDLGDILRNAGYALPIGGQIVGGIAGATAGSAVPGAGTFAGGMTGSVGGALAGESARLSLGKLLGIDPTLLEASGSLAKEGALAAGGELISQGVGLTARTAANTPAGRALGQFWKDTSSSIGKGLTKQIAKFVGAIDNDAVEISSRVNYQNLTPEYFRPEKIQEISKNTLFGTSKVREFDLQNLTQSGARKGTELLTKSIKQIKDPEFNNFIKQFSGLSDETINTIQSSDVANILNPSNLSDSKPVQIANSIRRNAEIHLDTIGKQLAKTEREAIEKKGVYPFSTDDIAKGFDNALRQSGLTGNKKLAEGFKASTPINVKGKQQLFELRNLFGQKLTDSEIAKRFGKANIDKYRDKFFFYGQKAGKNQVLESLNVKGAQTVRQRMDILADEIFQNPNIPSSLKRMAKDTIDQFRERYHTSLGIKDISSKYSTFRNLLDEARIDPNTVTNELINKVNRLGSMNTAIQESIESVLQEIPNGKVLSDEIRYLAAGNELQKVDPLNVLKRLEGELNQDKILKLGKTNTAETYLKQADVAFKNSKNQLLKSRQFFDDAQLSLAAKKFIEGSPNLLRVGAVRSLLGMSAAGGMVGGPAGAAFGGVTSLTVSNPQNIAKVLQKLGAQKGLGVPTQQIVRSTPSMSSRVGPVAVSQFLRDVAGRNSQHEQEKDRR